MIEQVIVEVFGSEYSLETLDEHGVLLKRHSPEVPSALYLGWTNSLQFVVFDSVIGLVRFDEVENMIRPILQKFKVEYPSFGNWPATLTLVVRTSSQEVRCDDLQSVRIRLLKVNAQIDSIEESYFKRITSVLEASNYLRSLTEKQLATTVESPVLVRKFVVDFLAGAIQDPRHHFERIIREYSEAEKLYPKRFKNHDKVMAEVFDSLTAA